MRSVADDLKAESREQLARLHPMARVELALSLGDEDAMMLARARGIAVADARRLFAARRAAGRVASVANIDMP
jgi:hypothetical protein